MQAYSYSNVAVSAANDTSDGVSAASIQSVTRIVLNTYDGAGRQLTSTNGANETTRYSYDLQGKVIRSGRWQVTQGSGSFALDTRYAYDTQGRKIAERDANGRTMDWTYNYFGQLQTSNDFGLERSDASNTTLYQRKTSYAYDKAGQLTRQKSENGYGQDLRYQYDAAGQLVQIVDAYLGQTTRYTYDLGGRRLSEQLRQRTTADGHVWAFINYDQVGNRVKTVTSVINTLKTDTGITQDASHADQTTLYSYDKMNRQVSDGAHTYTYDLAGRRIADHSVILNQATHLYDTHDDTYSYDNLNRLTSVQRDSTANWEVRQYDAAGRVVYSKGAAQNETTSDPVESWSLTRYNQYDSLGQLSTTRSVTRKDTPPRATVPGGLAHVTDTRYTQYDAVGNLKTTTVDTNNDANPDNTY